MTRRLRIAVAGLLTAAAECFAAMAHAVLGEELRSEGGRQRRLNRLSGFEG